MKRVINSAQQSKGVFWYTDDGLLAFPYDPEMYTSGLSKNGLSYTHKKLWPGINQNYKNKPFNYFPRGRVDIDNKNRSVIYMNPNVPESAIADIRKEFGIRNEPVIKYDCSNHYKCYLDDGWVPEK